MGNHYFQIRAATAADANAIIDIDIKCFEEAWTPDEWSRVGYTKEYAVSVATNFGTPIGLAVFMRDQERNSIQIMKIAVKPLFRRHGISRRLLDATSELGARWDAKTIFIVVPESTIYPGPDNLSTWLKALGFEATEFLKDCFTSYGETEDGVKFVSPTNRSFT